MVAPPGAPSPSPYCEGECAISFAILRGGNCGKRRWACPGPRQTAWAITLGPQRHKKCCRLPTPVTTLQQLRTFNRVRRLAQAAPRFGHTIQPHRCLPTPRLCTAGWVNPAAITGAGRQGPMDANSSLKSKLPSRHATEGPDRAPHRAFYYAMGLTTAQIHQPFVGV